MNNIDVLELIVTDEYANIGGSYIIDPTTGKRKPADVNANENQAHEKITVTNQPLIDEVLNNG